MKMRLWSELLCFLCIVVGVNSFLTNDPCSFRQSSNFQPDEVHFIDIPKECTSGNIIWSYPTGFIRIRLSLPNTSFVFCVTERYAYMTGQVIEFTGGVPRPLSKPTSEAGAPACSQSVDGSTDIAVQALPELVYMTSFNYTVTTVATTF